MNDSLVWIDCEMTGLDLKKDALIEVACLITDGELNQLDEGINVVIKPPQEALDQMGEFVTQMHTTSGLLAELENGVTLAEAEQLVLDHVRQLIPEPKKVPLCGNTIATDRAFLARDMPRVDEHLHYRMVDVSSVKELPRRWYPRVYFAGPEKPAATGRSPTSPRASGSCVTSAPPRSCPRLDRTVPRPRPSPLTSSLAATGST